MTATAYVKPMLLGAATGAALAGVWLWGQKLGSDLAANPGGIPGPPLGARAFPNPAQHSPEGTWDEARLYVSSPAVERAPLPNQCNPLDPNTWGQDGRRCAAAGDIFLSVSPSSQNQVTTPGPTEVAFSENLQHYNVGAAWFRGVLDRWLTEQTPSQEPTAPVLLALRTAGWPLSTANTLGGILGAAQALREFAQTHYVKTPHGSVRIIDLPSTPATDAFRTALAAHIAEASS